MSHLSEIDVYAKTIYAEARGELEEGQMWVAWVIKNRANANKSYWGRSIKEVCLKSGQFECWNDVTDIKIDDIKTYTKIKSWLGAVYNAPMNMDPTKGCDHYNNPDKEGYPKWTENCNWKKKIGNHQFYQSK